MVDFSFFRSDNQEFYKHYNCDLCRQRGDNEKRYKCFLRKRAHELVMPLIPKNFNKQLKSKKSDIRDMTFVKREATKQDVIDYYSIVRDLLPNERAFKVWMMDFMRLGKGGKPICPIPFFKQKLRNIVDWESAASKYNSLPFEGSYLDQPLFVIEGFNIVRAAESLYNSKKMEETEKKNQSNNINTSQRRRR